MDLIEAGVRLGVAAALGISLGLNRYLHHKSIGVRTLGLVAVAACALVAALADFAGPEGVTRGVQGLITGIGFLGAGLIFHHTTTAEVSTRVAVSGLTTATTVWVATIVGILCGLAAWSTLAPAAAIMAVLLLAGGRFEKAVARRFGQFRKDPDDPSTE